ncbi:MAG TPA: ABC transporter substrate-binding protein [Alphaproteobacteria bacterium]|nr:ABC transporter substrate-binding protein [Alphaproteobacteria bacterium]
MSAPSAARASLEVIVFPGGFNWPIWVAQAQGYFEARGLEVRLTPTPGSIFQLTNLIDGKFDLAMTAIDNLIAYNEGQGEAPTRAKPDLVAVMGGDNGFLHLVSVPEVASVAALKGKQLSVDARTTGYAFVLRKLLERGGLGEGDYELVKAGGVLERFQALLEKKHAGTLLLSPFELMAGAKGFHKLASAIDAFGHYQGLVAAVRRDWASAHKTELVAYIGAYVAAVDWLYRPENKAAALEILRANLPQLAPEMAERVHGVLLDPRHGFTRGARIDMAGVETVIALREQYGEPRKKLKAPERYVDLAYYDAATRR